MKFETVKTFILIILIGTSLLLTFGLWTYQPNHTPLNNVELVNEVNIGGMEERRSTMILPSTIIFHYYDQYFGYEDPSSQHALFRELQNWEMDSFEVGEADPDRTPDTHEMELLFPEEIPMDMITSIFSIQEDREEMPNWSFKRMYITFDQDALALEVTFSDINEQRQASAIIIGSKPYNEVWTLINSQQYLREYLVINEEEDPVYFPSESTRLTHRSLSVTNVSSDMLVSALFSTPSIVSRSASPNINLGGTYYTDGIRELSVDQSGNTMEFFEPATTDYPQMGMGELMRTSIQSINDHMGWTGEYNLLEMDQVLNKISYQMYYDGFPVFNDFNMTDIVQEWRNQNLYRYERPLFRINNLMGSEEAEIISGEGLYNYLLESDYNLERISEIKIGYDLTYHDDLNDYVTLEPGWFMKYNDSWQKIQFEIEDPPTPGGD